MNRRIAVVVQPAALPRANITVDRGGYVNFSFNKYHANKLVFQQLKVNAVV
jgi:hypothetical protein